MARFSSALWAAGLLVIGNVATAAAHITLETGAGSAEQHLQGRTARAARLRWQCHGAIRVQLPEGVIAAKPMPKPGWKLATITGKYAKSYDYYGTSLTEGVTEIAWTGGNLPDAWYDEFVFRVALTDFPIGSVVYFPVVQECPDGKVERWIEIPAAGKSDDDYETPAPGLKIKAGSGGDD